MAGDGGAAASEVVDDVAQIDAASDDEAVIVGSRGDIGGIDLQGEDAGGGVAAVDREDAYATVSGRNGAGAGDVAVDRADAGHDSAACHAGGRADRAIDLQGSGVDGRRAGVGVRGRKDDGAGGGLGETGGAGEDGADGAALGLHAAGGGQRTRGADDAAGGQGECRQCVTVGADVKCRTIDIDEKIGDALL